MEETRIEKVARAAAKEAIAELKAEERKSRKARIFRNTEALMKNYDRMVKSVQEGGICTVIVNKRGNPCPKCLPFCGKVLIDDVWSGGPKSGISPDTGKKYPLISKAIEYGLYHPRCKNNHTTYFEGISTADDS